MTVGVILCAYQAEDHIAPGPDCTIQAWVDLRARSSDRILIAAVSVPFEGFEHGLKDKTHAILRDLVERDQIDYLIAGDEPVKETEARGAALQWLVAQGADVLVQWDSDELACEQDLRAILAFVEANPWVTWFRLSLRNAVFTPDQYLVESFTPPRIHRVHSNRGHAIHFWDDNNIAYSGGITRAVVKDVELASMTIPASVANPRHLTWLNDDRSRCKVAYQTARGWESSFRWDEVKGLQFNEAYYARRGLPLPEVVHD